MEVATPTERRGPTLGVDHHAVAGLLTVPHAVQETCARRWRRGQETRAKCAL